MKALEECLMSNLVWESAESGEEHFSGGSRFAWGEGEIEQAQQRRTIGGTRR
jgi:hypothetical protein